MSDPGLGIRYLEVNWATEEQLVWVRDAKTGVSRYISKWYRGLTPPDPWKHTANGPVSTPVTGEKLSEACDFRQWVMSRMCRGTARGSELDGCMRTGTQETDDPINWWMTHQGSLPVLSQLALVVIAIPAMATDCERPFSLAKLS